MDEPETYFDKCAGVVEDTVAELRDLAAAVGPETSNKYKDTVALQLGEMNWRAGHLEAERLQIVLLKQITDHLGRIATALERPRGAFES